MLWGWELALTFLFIDSLRKPQTGMILHAVHLVLTTNMETMVILAAEGNFDKFWVDAPHTKSRVHNLDVRTK